MQFDNTEMAAVAQTQATRASQPPRLDLYAGIHKALRAAMADALLLVGRTDTTDAVEMGELTQRVHHLLSACEQHIAHENTFVHTAMEARAPGSSGAVAHEHQDHLAAIASLRSALNALGQVPDALRPAAAHTFYLRLAQFVADNLTHMLEEETEHNAILWAHHSDAELAEVHNALVASIPPAEMMDTLRWLLPSVNHAERVEMLADMQAHAPEPAFEGALWVARSQLPERDWTKLMAALGLPSTAAHLAPVQG